jgi:hypothetical protein
MGGEMKFKKKPVIIEAEQFTVKEYRDGYSMFMDWRIQHDDKGYYLMIPTLEGIHRASEGDWIIRGVAGEFYPCKPNIFEQTYEKCDEWEAK